MEEIDVLVVGQGLAGTWLSWWLEQAGLSCLVIDDADHSSASIHAAGLINPVTGRRMVKTWMIDELMPFAWKAYQDMGLILQSELITETSVIDFFPTVQMLQAFQKKYAEDSSYLHIQESLSQASPGANPMYAGPGFETWFRFGLGWGSICPCYLVRTEKLLTGWRDHLRKTGNLREERFDVNKLVLTEPFIEYADKRAHYIVFCDGRRAAENKFFKKLPFALNKGEGLLVEIKDIPQQTVFKKGMSIIPWRENIFWVGSSYQWEFADDQPSENFRLSAENWIKNFLKVPFKIMDHFAAVRPATLERRPFVGFHPGYPRVGMFNGLGTKGCSLAPYFAAQLVEKIAGRNSIDPLVDIRRFERVLGKQN